MLTASRAAVQWSKRRCGRPVRGLIGSPATGLRFQIRMSERTPCRSMGNLNRSQARSVVCAPTTSTAQRQRPHC